jgi:hypothetical protein
MIEVAGKDARGPGGDDQFSRHFRRGPACRKPVSRSTSNFAPACQTLSAGELWR